MDCEFRAERMQTHTYAYSGVFVVSAASMISMNLHCGAHGSRCHWHSFNCLSLSLCSECKVNTRWRDCVRYSSLLSNCSSQWTLTCDLRGWFSSSISFSLSLFLSLPSQRKQKTFFYFKRLTLTHCTQSSADGIFLCSLFLWGWCWSGVPELGSTGECIISLSAFQPGGGFGDEPSGGVWQGYDLWPAHTHMHFIAFYIHMGYGRYFGNKSDLHFRTEYLRPPGK